MNCTWMTKKLFVYFYLCFRYCAIYIIHTVSGPHLCRPNTPSYLLFLFASLLQDKIKQNVLYFYSSLSRRSCETLHNISGDLFSVWKCKSIYFISHWQLVCGSQGYISSVCAIFIVCCTKQSCLYCNDTFGINNISGNVDNSFLLF